MRGETMDGRRTALAMAVFVAVGCGSQASPTPASGQGSAPSVGVVPPAASGGVAGVSSSSGASASGAGQAASGSSGPAVGAGPGAAVSGPSATVKVTGGQTVNVVIPKATCATIVESDGSASVNLDFRPQGAGWEFQVVVSVPKKGTLSSTLQMSTDTNKTTDPYQVSANFLDGSGKYGSGWTVGGMHGVLLPGTITLKPDLSGSLDVPMKGFQPADKLPDIHVVARWTCQ